MRQEPIAYINVEQRKLEFAKPIMWHTPTVVNLERIPLYTHQRTWVGLTDEELEEIRESTYQEFIEIIRSTGRGKREPKTFAKAIEAKLKQKNGFAEEKNT